MEIWKVCGQFKIYWRSETRNNSSVGRFGGDPRLTYRLTDGRSFAYSLPLPYQLPRTKVSFVAPRPHFARPGLIPIPIQGPDNWSLGCITSQYRTGIRVPQGIQKYYCLVPRGLSGRAQLGYHTPEKNKARYGRARCNACVIGAELGHRSSEVRTDSDHGRHEDLLVSYPSGGGHEHRDSGLSE
ncbi:hypothetical protein C7212DRAFT_363496 [Tuber magnatum]|uniref:Uncharacterized protein n=1 Tax=Tuber magnatum TaxID=42249 RepID=A0A317ST30_9PEZI|nr:hypothetical protein C7212DRAFT_363496 [Tuber magnatum]